MTTTLIDATIAVNIYAGIICTVAIPRYDGATGINTIPSIRIDKIHRLILHIRIPVQRLRRGLVHCSPTLRVRAKPAPRRRIVFAEEEVVDARAGGASDDVLILAGEGAVGRASLIVSLAEGRVGFLGVDSVPPRRGQAARSEPVGMADVIQAASIVNRGAAAG